jgi:hypothetical protein
LATPRPGARSGKGAIRGLIGETAPFCGKARNLWKVQHRIVREQEMPKLGFMFETAACVLPSP